MFFIRSSSSIEKFVFLPPATKLGQGYIFTGVCDSVHRGSTLAGTPPWDQVQPFPREQVHPLDPGTPLSLVQGTPQDQVHPSRTRHTPRDQVHPTPGAVYAGRYGQEAGGTHPTGMHSCYILHLLLTLVLSLCLWIFT